ncbi:protein CEBPZOS [Cylas formicarius]|uniref:protein CEBPZOS n=1 Tax=Cylas formicarius TaxID=197179 RepID=UPI0029585F3E|nr:protein CEBPZOS [Cylas formicarius]
MLIKTPKSTAKKYLKRGFLTLFVAESLCFVATYGIWYKVNTDRETRKYLKLNYPSLLEVYYKTGEFIDSNNRIRQLDQTYWEANESFNG